MRFSDRTGWEPGETPWAEAVRSARAGQRALLDLTVSNPTPCGLGPGPEASSVLAPLADPRALGYTPEPLGMRPAREAVTEYYRDHGAAVAPEQICLTTSTSEAYSFLFRLLCDPGDEVLMARPSYPLLDLLARLEDVEVREYPLLYDPGVAASDAGGWSIDLHALESMINERTRAILVVHPNNPTGNYVSPAEAAALRRFCGARGLALVADEVFLDYPLDLGGSVRLEAPATFAAGGGECLCFVLSGLSKVCALPQMKLSWIAMCGPPPLVQAAGERLEIVADTFLSVSAPVQCALPAWLAQRRPVQEAICARLRANVRQLDARLCGSAASRFTVEGGWTAVLRVPRHVEGEPFAVAALGRGVIVQPGELYGLPEGRCVLSLLTPTSLFGRGLEALPL